MKFEIRDITEGGYRLWNRSEDWLIAIGDIYLYKKNVSHQANCCQLGNRFNYPRIQGALCGKINPEKITPKRIVVIQMTK